MCGFVGYFGKTQRDLSQALCTIKHRGPDMSGLQTGANWGVGFCRLSIIDLSTAGMQPFRYDDVIVYLNGEVYNYIELISAHKSEFTPHTESDVEIIPFLYRKYGITFLNLINGMFSMVLIDQKTSERFLIRDRFGKKPLYYNKKPDEIIFSSEIKALQALSSFEVNSTNIAMNLHGMLLIDPVTLFNEVFSVCPGSYIHVNSHLDIVEKNWYKPAFVAASPLTLQGNVEKIFSDSVNLRLRSDVPVGIFLSGGLDSVLIAHYARQAKANLHAFTARIVDKESWENNSTDTVVAPRFCKDYQIPNSEVVIDFDYWNRNILKISNNFEDIFVDSGNLIFYALAERAASEGIKVVYTGVGGDESFGGYPWQTSLNLVPASLQGKQNMFQLWISRMIYALSNSFPHSRATRRIKITCDLFLNPYFRQASSLGASFYDVMRDAEQSLVAETTKLAENYFLRTDQIGIEDWMNKINYANIFNLVKRQNIKSDMGCMAFSVENRSPFLDYRLMELMLGVPHALKVQGGPKSLLREFAKTALPHYVVSAPKSGPTMPVHIWFSNPKVKQKVIRFIQKNCCYIGDIVSADLANHVKNDVSFFEGKTGSLRIFALISYVLWAHKNIGKLSIDPSQQFTDYAMQ